MPDGISSQAILAAFYLKNGEEALANQIFRDMENDTMYRLLAVRKQILATEKEYFEINDRGTNFHYIEEDLKPYLLQFFDYFAQLK